MFGLNHKRLKHFFLNTFPEQLRFELMRNKVHLNHNWPSPSLEIKIATSEEELESAYRLLHDSYVNTGFMKPHSTGMRILPQHLLPQTATIVAMWDKRVIGTLSLIRDNPFGLPLEKIFDISSRRTGKRRLAEVSSLAIDPSYRSDISKVSFPLFRFVYQYARHFFGTHEFVIAVNPSMANLYLGLMCFEKLEKATKSYNFVNGAKAVGLFLNFENCSERWLAAFGSRPDHQNLYRYWTAIPDEVRNQLPKRKYFTATDLVITPQLLENFFLEKGEIWKTLTISDIKTLIETYQHPKYQEVFERLYTRYQFSSFKSQRIEVQMPAQIDEVLIGEVLDISKNELLLRTNERLTIGQMLPLRIRVNNEHWMRIDVQIVWMAQDAAGAQVINPCIEWIQMIQTLETDFESLAIGRGPSS